MMRRSKRMRATVVLRNWGGKEYGANEKGRSRATTECRNGLKREVLCICWCVTVSVVWQLADTRQHQKLAGLPLTRPLPSVLDQSLEKVRSYLFFFFLHPLFVACTSFFRLKQYNIWWVPHSQKQPLLLFCRAHWGVLSFNFCSLFVVALLCTLLSLSISGLLTLAWSSKDPLCFTKCSIFASIA